MGNHPGVTVEQQELGTNCHSNDVMLGAMVRCHGGAIQCHCLIKKTTCGPTPFCCLKAAGPTSDEGNLLKTDDFRVVPRSFGEDSIDWNTQGTLGSRELQGEPPGGLKLVGNRGVVVFTDHQIGRAGWVKYVGVVGVI